MLDHEADNEERWRPIGEIDPATGRSTVDLTPARLRPLKPGLALGPPIHWGRVRQSPIY